MVMLPRLARRALASATDRESIAKYLTRQCPAGVGDDVVADGIVEGLYHEDVDVVGLVDHDPREEAKSSAPTFDVVADLPRQ